MCVAVWAVITAALITAVRVAAKLSIKRDLNRIKWTRVARILQHSGRRSLAKALLELTRLSGHARLRNKLRPASGESANTKTQVGRARL